jgi:hypothetical protein
LKGNKPPSRRAPLQLLLGGCLENMDNENQANEFFTKDILALEVDHQYDLLQVSIMGKNGRWRQVFGVLVNHPVSAEKYQYPLSIKLGYAHNLHFGSEGNSGDIRSVMPQASLPEQSSS